MNLMKGVRSRRLSNKSNKNFEMKKVLANQPRVIRELIMSKNPTPRGTSGICLSMTSKMEYVAQTVMAMGETTIMPWKK